MSKNIKAPRVAAITVTFNRSQTLKKTISSLSRQHSDSLEKIIIVDNNSNQEHKNKINEIAKIDKRIEVIYLNENLGGAGGFHAGIEYVKNNYNYDWYWIMDDDAYPRTDCLANLLSNIDNENIGFLAPLIFGVEKEKYQLYHHKKVSNNLISDVKLYNKYEDIPEKSKVQANAFVGPLINANVVKQLGNVDKDLFIYGDDTEYTYRIARNFECYLIRDAIIDHEDILHGTSNLISRKDWWKQYYKYRNRYLFINKYSEHCLKRVYSNLLLTIYIGLIAINEMFKKHEIKTKKVILATLKKSIIDGLSNVNGKTIDPLEFITNVSRL